MPFLIVDGDEPVTCSKIAAGLITPLTGRRMALNEDYSSRLLSALRFYRRRESQLGVKFLRSRHQVRLFKNDEAVQRWAKRGHLPEFARFVSPTKSRPLVDESLWINERGGFEMKHAAWIDTRVYLEASRSFFAAKGCWQAAEVPLDALTFDGEVVRWEGCNFSHAALCIGWRAMQHPLFSWVPFEPARGVILTAKADLQGEKRIVQCECWVQPRDDGTVRIGSTYETRFTDPHGFDETQTEGLLLKLRKLLRVPVEIVEQQSAVRPIIARQRTLLGRHPVHERLLFLNGLGSKGSLNAPHFADILLSHVLDGEPIPTHLDVRSNM